LNKKTKHPETDFANVKKEFQLKTIACCSPGSSAPAPAPLEPRQGSTTTPTKQTIIFNSTILLRTTCIPVGVYPPRRSAAPPRRRAAPPPRPPKKTKKAPHF